jgi:FtsP/CotA-like multicopper oxidase with cupredoxin domain
MINGEIYPEVTVEELRLGRPAIIEVRNLSATEHPFHMHGMAFELLSVDGLAVGARRMEDTVNVRMQQALRLRVVPPNPGEWMVHCHVLSHEHQGMMTFVTVPEG